MSQEITEVQDDGRSWAAVCHLAGFLGWIIPLGNIIGPLAIWLFKKNKFSLVNSEGKKCLNFQISFEIYLIILFLISMSGFFMETYTLSIIVMILGACLEFVRAITMILAAIRVCNHKSTNYPLVIRFIR